MKHRILSMFLAGTLLISASCIDNDEPEGLQEMRKAKAELMQASAAVQLAEAELRKAEAIAKEAEARITAAQAEALEIANAIQSARDEAEKEELKFKLERLAEKHKADLQQLMAATANWEAEYQKALIDLEATLATYRNSKYAGELQTVLGDLTTVRGTITTLRGQIAGKQAELITYITRDSLTANRRIRTAVTTARKEYDLGVEKVDLLKKTREGNVAQWGQTRDEMAARMEALKTDWTKYNPTVVQMNGQLATLIRKIYEQQYAIDGNRQNYRNNLIVNNMEPDPNIDATRKVSFDVPVALQPLFESHFNGRGFEKQGDRYTREVEGLEPALREMKYAFENGTYLYQDFPDNVSLYGLIPEIEKWQLSDNDLAHAGLLKAQYDAKTAELKDLYNDYLDLYSEHRSKFIAAAEAYGYDWTRVNDNAHNHLWFPTQSAVWSFYYAYDEKIAEEPLYHPTDAELKTVAAQIANYLLKRVNLTSEYWLDPLVVLDPLKPAETVRLSTALTASGIDADAFRRDYFISSGAGRTVMGNREDLTWNVFGNQNPDWSKYDNLIGNIANFINALYGLSYNNNGELPLVLIDLDPEKDLTVAANGLVTDYTQIVPNNYSVALNVPIEKLPYALSGGASFQSLERLYSGCLYEYLTWQAATADLTALIASQADVTTLIGNAGKCHTELLTVYNAAFAALKSLNAEYQNVFSEYNNFIYNHRLELTANGQINSVNLSLAEQEYAYCKQMHDLLNGYINKAEIVLSDGSKYDVYSDIDTAIELAEQQIDKTTPNGLYEKLEQAEANLAAWETLGYDGVAAALGNQLRDEIADLQAALAEAQAEFERCSELKDRLIELMKAE